MSEKQKAIADIGDKWSDNYEMEAKIALGLAWDAAIEAAARLIETSIGYSEIEQAQRIRELKSEHVA